MSTYIRKNKYKRKKSLPIPKAILLFKVCITGTRLFWANLDNAYFYSWRMVKVNRKTEYHRSISQIQAG